MLLMLLAECIKPIDTPGVPISPHQEQEEFEATIDLKLNHLGSGVGLNISEALYPLRVY